MARGAEGTGTGERTGTEKETGVRTKRDEIGGGELKVAAVRESLLTFLMGLAIF